MTAIPVLRRNEDEAMRRAGVLDEGAGRAGMVSSVAEEVREEGGRWTDEGEAEVVRGAKGALARACEGV